MDLVYGSEISFPDGFATKPFRTFVVNTNAPIHSNGFDVPPSAGIATFPHSSNYRDRIFLWRAVGQKLFIEERSLIYPITDGSLCIDFTRTAVIPGTSITIFEEGILCIVVPTASAIHRFYARLHAKGRDTFSILARIKEDDEFRRFRTSHSLTTPGRPLRASATHHPNKNTITYCTAEGQLVVVTMGSYTESSDKHEEFTIGEVGLLGKLLGGRDKRVSDVCVMKSQRLAAGVARERKSAVQSDILFAVTRDGWVQAWNVETRKQLPTSVDLNEFSCSESKQSENDDSFETTRAPKAEVETTENVYSIKAYQYEADVLLVVGCDVVVGGKSVTTRVHLIRVAGEQMQHLRMLETIMSADERLVDIELLQTYFPPKESDLQEEDRQDADQVRYLTSAQFSLTALFKSSSAEKSYSLRRISFSINWSSAETLTQFDWHPVKQFSSPAATRGEPVAENSDGEGASERPYNLSADSSVDTLVDVVFDTDLYSFDIVFRAVQIVTDNFRGSSAQIHHNNWSELSKLVDTYLTSVEFNRKFQQKTDRSIRLRLNAPQETQTTALKDFWWALLRACEELDFAARGAIALAPMQLAGELNIMAVVHKDRMTILGDNNTDFLSIITPESVGKTENSVANSRKIPYRKLIDLIEEASVFADRRVYLMNRERARITNAKNGIQSIDDDLVESGYDDELDGRFLNVSQTLEEPIVNLADAFVKSCTFDNSKPFEDPCGSVFGGTFTQSLVAANIRVTVETRVHFALTLRAIFNAISEKKSRAGVSSFGDVEALCCELREIIRVYRELNEQLDLKIYKNGAKMSVCTWLTSDNEGLQMMKREGGLGPESPDGYQDVRETDYNWFVGVTSEAAVRALLSTSEVLVLFRRLVSLKQYKVLLTILNSYISETRALKPVITFYRGIACAGTGHPVKALNAFQSCLEAFKEGNEALRKAVYYLLPKRLPVSLNKNPLDELGTSEYYLTVVRFLQDNGHSEQVCSVAMNAIENLPIENESVQLIANTLFTHLTTRREWFQALKLILKSTLRAETRRASICELLTIMLAVGEWEAIATLKFGVHEQVVEDFLRDSASRQSPAEKKHLYELLYAFYTTRKEFRKAACAMYEYARHIETATQMTPELLRRRRDCLATVLNIQSVLGMEPDDDEIVYDDHTDTNLVFPEPVDEDEDVVDEHINEADYSGEPKRPPAKSPSDGSSKDSTSQSSPESTSQSSGTTSSGESVNLVALKARQMAFATSDEPNEEMEVDENNRPAVFGGSSGKQPLSKRRRLLVFSEKDIRDEWVLCSARVGLLSSDQYKGVPPTDPFELFSLLVETFHFDEAFDIARQFVLDSQKLFLTLTREAIKIDSLRDDVNIEMAATQQAGWVRLNRRHCLAVATTEDHWAVVRGLVNAARSEWPGDSRALRGAVEAFLSYQLTVPYWLHSVYEKHDVNDYLRCLMDFENYPLALQVLGELVEKQTLAAAQPNARVWLPHAAIDELMNSSADVVRRLVAKSPDDQVLASEIATLRKQADQKMLIYFRKVADFEHGQRMSNRYFDK